LWSLAAPAAQITVPIVAASVGGSVAADLQFAAQGVQITGLQFDLQFDSSLTLTATLGAAGSNAGKSLSASDMSPGVKRFLVAGLNQTAIADGVVLTLKISVPASAGTNKQYSLHILNAGATDKDGKSIALPATDGAVTVGTPPATIAAVNAVYAGPDIAQNTWVEIHGSGLAPSDVGPGGFDWSTAPDFASGRMPTQLKGVSVKVNGKPAYIYWISPTQVNVLVPLDNTQGPVQVQVTNGLTTTAPFTVNMKALAPAFFLLGATKYIVAQHADYSLMGPTSMSVSGYAFSPAKPGETILLYATGFSLPVVALVDGSATQVGALPNLPLVQVGGAAAPVAFAGVISPGLYQMNVVVPASSPNGDNTVTVSYAGFTTQAGAVISVQR
jgi:uncharacterized protein (TIGR03437 family)